MYTRNLEFQLWVVILDHCSVVAYALSQTMDSSPLLAKFSISKYKKQSCPNSGPGSGKSGGRGGGRAEGGFEGRKEYCTLVPNFLLAQEVF